MDLSSTFTVLLFSLSVTQESMIDISTTNRNLVICMFNTIEQVTTKCNNNIHTILHNPSLTYLPQILSPRPSTMFHFAILIKY